MIKIESKVNTIIWDLDGTMLDSFGVMEDILKEILPNHGYEVPSRALLLKNFHGSLDDVISAVLGGLTSEEVEPLLKNFLANQDAYYEFIDEHLFPDAVDLARRAHQAGKRQILVTNRSHKGRLRASPRHIVESSELKDYIDLVICGDDGEHRKPKPAVLGSLSITPSETLVIGDQFVDAELAYNLGCKAILINRNDSEQSHLDLLPDEVCSNSTIVDSLQYVTV